MAVCLTSFFELARVLCNLLNEVLVILPTVDTEVVHKLFMFHFVKNRLDIVLRVRDALSPDNTLQNFISLRLVYIVDNSGTINQVDSFSELDILPDFRLTWNRRHFATSLLHKRVDYRRLSNIRITNKPNTDRLFFLVENVELFQ